MPSNYETPGLIRGPCETKGKMQNKRVTTHSKIIGKFVMWSQPPLVTGRRILCNVFRIKAYICDRRRACDDNSDVSATVASLC